MHIQPSSVDLRYGIVCHNGTFDLATLRYDSEQQKFEFEWKDEDVPHILICGSRISAMNFAITEYLCDFLGAVLCFALPK